MGFDNKQKRRSSDDGMEETESALWDELLPEPEQSHKARAEEFISCKI